MGFLNNLFGDNSRKLILQDKELGTFTVLASKDDEITWKGEVKFLGEKVVLYMRGDKLHLNALEKASLFEMLKNEKLIELDIERVLKEQCENADKEFSKWPNQFKCISILTSGNETEITFEENESLYHFNIYFLSNKLTGVSVDG